MSDEFKHEKRTIKHELYSSVHSVLHRSESDRIGVCREKPFPFLLYGLPWWSLCLSFTCDGRYLP